MQLLPSAYCRHVPACTPDVVAIVVASMTLVENLLPVAPLFHGVGPESRHARRSKLRIGICSTYAPRACGLATFAADLERALLASPDVEAVTMLALDNGESPWPARSGSVLARIADHQPASYRAAAKAADAGCDVVIVQHEFGIFGGTDGAFVIDLLDALHVPVVLTLHTVVPSFTPGERDVLRRACARAAVVTVFTSTARELLLEQGIAESTRIEVVAHGAPGELYDVSRSAARRDLDVSGRFVLSTFGLVSEGKGIELAIDALPDIISARPDTLFVIAGRTHPEVVKRHGERYRERLVAQVHGHGITDHVRFIDGFLPVPAIAQLLAATDVFLTPYVNPDQIVSGALTFALAAGCPVVSTPYQYARDVLLDGAGTIVESRHAPLFAEAVRVYGLQPEAAARARSAAHAVGDSMRWTAVGRVVAGLCRSAMRADIRLSASSAPRIQFPVPAG